MRESSSCRSPTVKDSHAIDPTRRTRCGAKRRCCRRDGAASGGTRSGCMRSRLRSQKGARRRTACSLIARCTPCHHLWHRTRQGPAPTHRPPPTAAGRAPGMPRRGRPRGPGPTRPGEGQRRRRRCIATACLRVRPRDDRTSWVGLAAKIWGVQGAGGRPRPTRRSRPRRRAKTEAARARYRARLSPRFGSRASSSRFLASRSPDRCCPPSRSAAQGRRERGRRRARE